MSVFVGATVLQADHHKLMLTATPLDRHGGTFDGGAANLNNNVGVVGCMYPRLTIAPVSQTLAPVQMAQIIFAFGSGSAFTVTLPSVPDLCNHFNLQNGTYLEFIIVNEGGATLTVAPGDGMQFQGPDFVLNKSTRKLGMYIKDRTSTVSTAGADLWITF